MLVIALKDCSTVVCQNGGTCTKDSSGQTVCICLTGWTGGICSQKVSDFPNIV